MPRPLLTVLGTTGTAVGCAVMAASLPASVRAHWSCCDAQLLNSVSDRHDRGAMERCVLAWQDAHPQAQVEIVSS